MLKQLLPEIGATIDGIAEDGSQIIGDVAQIVARRGGSLVRP